MDKKDLNKQMASIMEDYIQVVSKRMERAKQMAEELTVEEMYELNDDIRMFGHIKKLQSGFTLIAV